MFWRKARQRYADVTSDDPDIRRYLAVSSEFQEQAYGGVVGYIQDLGHRWIASRTLPGPVLEIGFGTGRHRMFYNGRPGDYFVSDASQQHIGTAAWRERVGRGVRCDARQLPFAAGSFQTVISIYNLEHMPDTDAVLGEVHRVLAMHGHFLIALPCEGGLLWNVGREFTTRRSFQRMYGINYDKVIAYEHVWDYAELNRKIHASPLFRVVERRLWPVLLPTRHLNLIACLRCVRTDPEPRSPHPEHRPGRAGRGSRERVRETGRQEYRPPLGAIQSDARWETPR